MDFVGRVTDSEWSFSSFSDQNQEDLGRQQKAESKGAWEKFGLRKSMGVRVNIFVAKKKSSSQMDQLSPPSRGAVETSM